MLEAIWTRRRIYACECVGTLPVYRYTRPCSMLQKTGKLHSSLACNRQTCVPVMGMLNKALSHGAPIHSNRQCHVGDTQHMWHALIATRCLVRDAGCVLILMRHEFTIEKRRTKRTVHAR